MTIGYGLYGLPEPELPPRPPSKWRWPIRIIIALMVIVGVAVALLSMVGGNSENLRTLLEQQVHESSGYSVRIGTLNAASFYPVLGIDLDDLVLSGKESTGSVARFGHVNFSSGFWGATIGLPSLRSFDFRDVTLDAGFLTPQEFKIDRFYIDITQPATPTLRLAGVYDEQPVTLAVTLTQKKNLLGAVSYEMADDAVLNVQAGDLTLNGSLKKGKLRQRVVVINSLVTHPGAQPLTGEVALLRGYGNINYTGYLKSTSAPLAFDLTTGRVSGVREINGTIQADGWNVQDYAGIRQAYDDVQAFYHGSHEKTPEPIDLTALKVDVTASFKGLMNGTAPLGDIVVPMVVDNGFLRLSPLTGTIDNSALSGDVVLDATKIPARIDVSVRLDALKARGHHPSLLSMLWDGALEEHWAVKDLRLECVRGFVEISNAVATTDNLFFGMQQSGFYARGEMGEPVGGLDIALVPDDSQMKTLQVRGPAEKPVIRAVPASNGNTVFIPCGNKKP